MAKRYEIELGLVQYPEDVKKIKLLIPELAHLSDHQISVLWASFSEDLWCASWLVLTDSYIDSFRAWALWEEV